METRSGARDYGLILGQALVKSCSSRRRRGSRSSRFSRTSEDERTALLLSENHYDDDNYNRVEEDLQQLQQHQQEEEEEEEEERQLQKQEQEQEQEQKQKQKRKPHRPNWGEVFTRQSTLNLITYACMSMHNMAFDSQIPVLLHYPVRDIYNNPNVRLPFKFVSGFGVGE